MGNSIRETEIQKKKIQQRGSLMGPSSSSLRFIHSKMTTSSSCCCPRPPLFKIVALLFIFSLLSLILIIKMDDFASRVATQTKTVAGHNLGPTPWHLFPPKHLFNENTTTTTNRYSKASKFIKCSSYLTCLFGGGGGGGGGAATAAPPTEGEHGGRRKRI